MVCSGDSGVYGMSGLILEMARPEEDLEIEIIPGVTAALSGGAVLGAPLGHDFAVISLSDLLTPMELIEDRLKASAQADMVICLYNPSSKKRAGYLKRACEIVMEYKSRSTICGLVKNIGSHDSGSTKRYPDRYVYHRLYRKFHDKSDQWQNGNTTRI